MKVIFGLILIWLIASVFADLNKVFLPEIFGLGSACWHELKEFSLLRNCVITLGRVAGGVGLGLLGGIPLGLLVGVNPRINKELMPTIEFLRAIPTSMLFPVFIMTSGIGELSKLLIVVYATLPIVVVALAASGQGKTEAIARADYLNIHKSRLGLMFAIVAFLWDSIPALIAGLKVALSIGLVLVIVTEMFFSASSGVGWAARQAYLSYNVDQMYAYVLVVGILGYLLNALLDYSLTKTRIFVGHK
jgi:ABC-type nitrate/sulfonate/bicarbonate transport system permease component